MTDIPSILARQPILSLDGTVFGYELLYRGSPFNDSTAASVKSAQVLCEALSNPGLDGVVGEAQMFVNFGQHLLTTGVPLLLPSGQGVVEILEDVEPSPIIIETLRKVRRHGLEIALDDFAFQKNLLPFLAHANYIKVDIQQSAQELDDIVERLKPYQLPLIAEKVETPEQARRCRDLGFHLFQGYFFCQPETLQAKSVGSTQLAVVTLIAELQNADLTPEALARSIGRDLGLTHRILKLCNSAAYRGHKPIASIADAVIRLGRDLLAQWACLLMMARLVERKPLELVAVALIRARLCQTLGAANREFKSSELYTVGLLSVLDALLDRPMRRLIDELPLAESLRQALCRDPGSGLGAILRLAIAYESGDWGTLGNLTTDQEIRLSTAYADATQFARFALK